MIVCIYAYMCATRRLLWGSEHGYIHINIHTYKLREEDSCEPVHAHSQGHTYIHICIHTCTYTTVGVHEEDSCEPLYAPHTYIHTYIHTYVHTYTHTNINPHTQQWAYGRRTCERVCAPQTFTRTYIHTYIHIHNSGRTGGGFM